VGKKTARVVAGAATLALVAALAATTVGGGGAASSSSQAAKGRAAHAYGKLRLSFAPNRGQAPAGVDYMAGGKGYSLAISHTGAVLGLRSAGAGHGAATVGMRLLGANSHARALGQQALPGKVNYIVGNDRDKWHTGIPTYGRVAYRGVYPGVDIAWHGRQGRLEYDFVVQPGARPEQISFRVEGADRVRLDAAGSCRQAGRRVAGGRFRYRNIA
jgi:hypothetical protein